KLTRIWQVVLGLVFIIAAIMKAYDARAIANVLAFAGLKKGYFTFSLFGLLGVEAAVGVAVLVARPSRIVVVSAVALLISFTGFLLWLLRLPQAPPCGCFGVPLLGSARHEQLLALSRNLLFLGSGATCWMLERRHRDTSRWKSVVRHSS